MAVSHKDRTKPKPIGITASSVTSDDLEIDSGTLSIDATNNRVGIGTTSPTKTLSVDGDLHFQPTATSTGHLTAAGSLDIRATDNLRIGTDLADSIRIGRDNSSACKVHIRSGSDADLVVTDGKVGIGMEDPSDALEVDGDIQLTPTASSTAHLKAAGSLDVRCDNSLKIGTNGADSVKIGRTNTSAAKVHLQSGATTDLVVFNSQVGLGTETPGTQLQLESTAPYVTIKNSTAENTDGGCESKIIFEDHADVPLAQVEGSHSGSSDDTKGKLILSTHTGSALTAGLTINESQQSTFTGDVVVTGTTPKVTIGDAGTEDTMLVFDGNAVDFRMGIYDSGDRLEIGKGAAHNTTPAIIVSSTPQVMTTAAFGMTTGGTFGTFSDGDATPSVGTGNLWKHHASTQTITMFDDGVAGQVINVISTAAITYDVTSTNLKGGSVDLVTASGDVTQWFFDGTNWYLTYFMDVSADHSTIAGGGTASDDSSLILHMQVFA